MSFFNKKEDKIINSSDYIFCSKCGEPMKPDARYCMKCGALNYEHPDNGYMKNYVSVKKLEKKNKKDFEENKDNNKFVEEEKEETNIQEPIKESKKIIYIPINIIILILLIIAFIIYLMVK